jgi:hypothetical protein
MRHILTIAALLWRHRRRPGRNPARLPDALREGSRQRRFGGTRRALLHHQTGRRMELRLLPHRAPDPGRPPRQDRQADHPAGAGGQRRTLHRCRQGGQVVPPQLQRHPQPRSAAPRKRPTSWPGCWPSSKAGTADEKIAPAATLLLPRWPCRPWPTTTACRRTPPSRKNAAPATWPIRRRCCMPIPGCT